MAAVIASAAVPVAVANPLGTTGSRLLFKNLWRDVVSDK